MIRPLEGPDPSLDWKLWRTVSLPEESSLNTVPYPYAPPLQVGPYKLPVASMIRPPEGSAPSLPPVKLYSTVKVPEGASLNRSEEHTSELQSLRHLVCRL